MYVHIHRAGKILCCSIMNWHQCPAIILSPFPVLTLTCRGWATGPAEAWDTAGRPGLFFFLNIFCNTVQPNLPSKALTPHWFHWLKALSLPWTLSQAGKRNEEWIFQALDSSFAWGQGLYLLYHAWLRCSQVLFTTVCILCVFGLKHYLTLKEGSGEILHWLCPSLELWPPSIPYRYRIPINFKVYELL